MNNCTQCGSPVPDEQSICSMCMGDINHGNDGYYQKWMEEQNIKEEREKSEREDYERECDTSVRNQ